MRRPTMAVMVALAVISASAHAGAAGNTVTGAVVRSWCPITHKDGIGQGATLPEAREAAVKACIDNGGVPYCCAKYTKQLQ